MKALVGALIFAVLFVFATAPVGACPSGPPTTDIDIVFHAPSCYYRFCGLGAPVSFSLHPQESGFFPPAEHNPGYTVQPCDTITWNFGDGTSPVTTHGAESVEHSYHSVGHRTITMTVANALGSATVSRPIDIDDVIRIVLGSTTTNESAAVAHVPLRRIGGLQRTASLRITAGRDLESSSIALFSQIVTFDPGETEDSVAIPIKNDSLYRGSRTEWVWPQDAVGAIAVTNGSIFIHDDEPQPVLSFDDVEVVEGNEGTTRVQLIARLSAPMGDGYVVWVNASHPSILIPNPPDWPRQTATPDDDFVRDSAAIIFNPGTLTGSATLTIKSDSIPEPDEVIVIAFSPDVNPSAWTSRRFATCTILDDDRGSLVVDTPSLSMRAGERATVHFSFDPPQTEPHNLFLSWAGSANVTLPWTVVIPPNGSAAVAVDASTPGTGTVTASAPTALASAWFTVGVASALALRIDTIAPAQATIAGGAIVEIGGSGFGDRCNAAFGTVAAKSVSTGSKSLIVIAPPHEAGSVDVIVTCPDGIATKSDGFTYVRPRRRAVSP